MSALHDFGCDVDHCPADAAELIETDDGERVLLCADHHDRAAEWTAMTVDGRWLIRDTAGSWCVMPDGGAT